MVLFSFCKKDADAYFKEGCSLSKKGEYRRAMNAFDKVLELDPKNIDAMIKKGDASMQEGTVLFNYLARECYDQVLKLDPKNSDAWCRIGVTRANVCDYNEALIYYNKALELDPKNGTAWSCKAIALDELGRTKEADEALAKAKEMGSFSALMRGKFSKLEKG